jgi:hypothetical protein
MRKPSREKLTVAVSGRFSGTTLWSVVITLLSGRVRFALEPMAAWHRFARASPGSRESLLACDLRISCWRG